MTLHLRNLSIVHILLAKDFVYAYRALNQRAGFPNYRSALIANNRRFSFVLYSIQFINAIFFPFHNQIGFPGEEAPLH